MDVAEVGVGDVGVDLGGADVGVAEEGLDGAEVGTVHEEVGREGVAEGVGGDIFSNTGEAGVFFDDALDGARGETAKIAGVINGLEVFAVVKKKGGEGIGARVEIITDAVGGGFGDEDGAIFFAFTADDEFTTVEVNGVSVETD